VYDYLVQYSPKKGSKFVKGMHLSIWHAEWTADSRCVCFTQSI